MKYKASRAVYLCGDRTYGEGEDGKWYTGCAICGRVSGRPYPSNVEAGKVAVRSSNAPCPSCRGKR